MYLQSILGVGARRARPAVGRKSRRAEEAASSRNKSAPDLSRSVWVAADKVWRKPIVRIRATPGRCHLHGAAQIRRDSVKGC